MSNKNIKYILYYAKEGDIEQRDTRYNLAVNNLVDYECNLWNRLGYNVEMISASRTRSLTTYFGRRKEQIANNRSLLFLPTFPQKNRFYRFLDRLTLNFFLFIELLKCKKNENVVVYHGMNLWRIIELSHKIRRFNWVLYVGEIFGDVIQDKEYKKKEIRHCTKADGYILATEHLDNIVNPNGKPYVALYGSYKNEPIRTEVISEKDATKIHCIYAGTFDSRKGEAQLAVKSAAYLPQNYCVHICGFGPDKDTENLINLITQINNDMPGKIVYEGRVSGEEYFRLLQKCDIGLFTPIAEADFNNTDFPSKIFSYLTNGLHVVSASVGPVKSSKVYNAIHFYDGSDPKTIAETIEKVDLKDGFDGRAFVETLEKELILDLQKIL